MDEANASKDCPPGKGQSPQNMKMKTPALVKLALNKPAAPPVSAITNLRQRAEEVFRKSAALSPEDLKAASPETIAQMLHELGVHQIELEMQNEEMRAAQLKLEESQARYFELYDLAPVGYCTVDQQGLVVESNLAAGTILGVARGKLVGSSLHRAIHKEDAGKLYLLFKRLLETAERQECELQMVRRDGTPFWAHLRTTIAQSEGSVPFIRIVMTDISARKQIEEALEKKTAEMERFTYAVSHDLKSPLVTIKTFLGFLEKDLDAHKLERVPKDLGIIHGAADKMGDLLNELLKLARIGYNKNDLAQMPLQEVVQEALSLVAGQIADRGVQVQVTQEPAWLTGDRPRLVEVFQNLIDNAVKFLGEQPDPLVTIGVEVANDEIVIFVRDNGKGIASTCQSNIFALFHQLDEGMPGSGLGLALVRRIVEMHGGKIWVESEGAGRGTTFRFTLAKTQLRQPAPSVA